LPIAAGNLRPGEDVRQYDLVESMESLGAINGAD
jgi:hypothetical protein